MKEIATYCQPLKGCEDGFNKNSLGELIIKHTPSLGFPDFSQHDYNIAIIGVADDRNAVNNQGCCLGADAVRKHLYRLYQGDWKIKAVDLGNIQPGHTVNDTYFAISAVVEELVKMKIIPVIIGGGQDITFANYLAYKNLEQVVNLVTIDHSFDLGNDPEDHIDSKSYLSKIILHQPNFLFNYSNIGYQTYFASKDSIDLMANLHFDIYRLGHMQSDLQEAEPVIRNADIMSFDLSAIRQSDAPGNGNASPNGFYGEEACQITRYAGLSDKLSSIGFYELNPAFDPFGQTAHLTAQMIWYFIDGYYNRKKDFPIINKKEYLKYRVAIKDNQHEIVFYKSKKSDRWWMDIPYPPNIKLKYERHLLVPCSYTDYQIACREEMPDKWWKAYQKLF